MIHVASLRGFRVVVGLVVLFTLTVAAAESAKTFRLVVDQTIQVGKETLAPGNYDAKVVVLEGQKGQLVVQLRKQTVVDTQVMLETLDKSSDEDGIRINLADGKTRVVEKLWFRGSKYVLILQGVPAAAQARP